jgi:long-chain fatty acid transport protein
MIISLRTARARVVAAVAVPLAIVAVAPAARAGGLYATDRGVRPLARGGAFVAGADDLGSIWYNPAGLADAGTSFLFDASWLNYSTSFTRQALVTDANGGQYTETFPTAKSSTPFLPIPTIAGSYAFGKRQEWTAAVGAFAPYTAISSYPEGAPSRYSLVSLTGSALVDAGLWLAYKPIEQVRIGIGVEALVGTFATSVVMSANPAQHLLTAPEDPSYDAFAQLKVGPIFAPTGNAGVTVVPERHVRIGLSGQLPTHIDAPATIQVKLPNNNDSVLFDNAVVNGDAAHVVFNLPAVLRAGVEVRPIDALRVEVAYVAELWSNHTEIDIIPNGVQINGITGFPSAFNVGTIVIPRHFQNSNSLRFGGEYGIPLGSYKLDVRAGVMLEQSAIPAAYESPLTTDLDKLITTLGVGFHVGRHWRFDLLYAHAFEESVNVSPSTAAVPAINPVKGNPTPVYPINAGTYSAHADVVGIGMNYRF